MSRPLRIEYEGAYYHIIQRGTERKNIYKEETNKEKFLKYLKEAQTRYKVRIHCYCLMDNHYHLIISTPQANLSKIMHYLNTSYAVYFNKKNRRVGPLFQGRYKSILIQADEYICELSRYIHNNPVRAKIVEKAEDYNWSTYGDYIGKGKERKWIDKKIILTDFGGNEKDKKKRYKNFVESKIEEDKEMNDKIYCGMILGTTSFVKDIIGLYLKDRDHDGEAEARDLLAYGEPTKEYIEKIVRKYEKDEKVIKKISVYMMRKYTSKTLKEIALEIGEIAWNAISKIYLRLESKRKKERSLDKKLNKIEKILE